MWTNFVKDNFCKPAPSFSASGRPRQQYIDLAKGVCMLLVVALHCSVVFHFDVPVIFRNLRMPLYFMLSGLFFRDYGGFLNLLEKKTNKIFVPLLFFTFTDFVFTILPGILLKGDAISKLSLCISNFPNNYALWFLIALGFDNFIFYFLRKFLRNTILILVFSIGLSLITYFAAMMHVNIPFYLAPAINGLLYFTFGQIIASSPIVTSHHTSWHTLAYGICMVALAIMIEYIFGYSYLDYRPNEWYGNPLLTILLSLLLVTGLMLICKRLKWLPIISYIGRYSIIVLGVHLTLMALIIFIPINFRQFPILYYILVLAASWSLIPIMRRFFPHFTAQTDGIIRLRYPFFSKVNI